MKTSPNRSTKRKHFRRNHPNNQTLVIDTSIGRKKQSPPISIRPPARPASNIATLAPSPIAAVHYHHHQQQQKPRHHCEGPPSPPAHLRASIIIAPPPPSQQQQQLAIPTPAHLAAYALSSHHQQRQPQQQSIFPQYAIHASAVTIAAKGSSSSSSSTYYLPAYSLRPYQQPQYLTIRNSIRKPVHRYSTRRSQYRTNQAPLTEFWNAGSTSNQVATSIFKTPMILSKGPWSPKKIYLAFRNKHSANQQQQQQQQQSQAIPEGRPHFFSPAPVNDAAKSAATANKSCIHLGFAAYMITSFMLAYNGIMSVLLLQASRALDDINVPVFIFWLVSLFTAMLSIFGFLALSLSSWTLLRVFHTMYLFTAILTFILMLAWLGVNQQQTGAWDRIMLDRFSSSSSPLFGPSVASEQHEVWLKTFLLRDNATGTWIISPAKWILAFLGIFLTQYVSWYWGLLAYDHQLRDRKLRDKKKTTSSTDTDNAARRPLPYTSEKV